MTTVRPVAVAAANDGTPNTRPGRGNGDLFADLLQVAGARRPDDAVRRPEPRDSGCVRPRRTVDTLEPGTRRTAVRTEVVRAPAAPDDAAAPADLEALPTAPLAPAPVTQPAGSPALAPVPGPQVDGAPLAGSAATPTATVSPALGGLSAPAPVVADVPRPEVAAGRLEGQPAGRAQVVADVPVAASSGTAPLADGAVPGTGPVEVPAPDGGTATSSPEPSLPADAALPTGPDGDPGEQGAGQSDAGRHSEGQTDAGRHSEGQADAGQSDVGQSDAGQGDAGRHSGAQPGAERHHDGPRHRDSDAPAAVSGPSAAAESAESAVGQPASVRATDVAASAPAAPGQATAGSTTAPVSTGSAVAAGAPGAPAGAPPGAPPGAPAGAGTSSVTGQVLPELARLVTRGDGTQRVTVKLAPEALGEVRIVLTVRRGEVHVRITGGEAAQAALLQGQSDLHRLLAGVGATSSSVQVGDQATTLAGHDGGSDQASGASGQPGSDVRRDASGQSSGDPDQQHRAGRGDRNADPTAPRPAGGGTPQQDLSRRQSSRLDVSV